jgi:tetratricopeptide (TPR) repeat protein
MLRHPEFRHLPPDLVAMSVREASPLLWLAFTANSDTSLLDVLAAAERRAASCVRERSPEQGDHLTGLGRALYERFARTGDGAALDEALDAFEHALGAVPSTGARENLVTTWDYQDVVQEAGNAYRDRYGASGDVRDLDRATELHRAAVAATPSGAPALARRLSELGSDLRMRYERTDRQGVLEEAIHTLDQALEQAAPDDPFRPVYEANLGNVLRDRHNRTRDGHDLDRAVSLHRGAIERSGPDAPWAYLHNLGLDLRARYRSSGDEQDREEALRCFVTALDRLDATDPARPMVLTDRAIALMDRYERTGSADDVAEAVAAFRKSVELTPPGSPGLPRRLLNLAMVLHTHHDVTGDLAALDEALSVLTDALDKDPALSDRVMITADRGFVLAARHEARGEAEDLGQAVDVLEEALTLGPAPSDRVWVLSTLGGALLQRYARTTRIDDLDRACTVLREAVEETAREAPDWPYRANSLAVALHQRFLLLGRQEDLDAALARVEAALQRLDPTAPVLPAVLTTLGALLAARQDTPGARPDDAVRAQAALRRAVNATPRGSTHRARRLSMLGASLTTWYRNTGEPRYLDAAMKVFQEAVDEVPDDAPPRAVYLRNLAEGYRMRYGRTRDPADLDAAVDTLRRCCALALDVDVESALSTGRTWGDWAAGRGAWREALEAYGIAVDAAERAFRAQLLRREKETWLREGGNLGVRAAQAAATTGNTVAAVAFLERGRALLLSEVLELARAEVGALASGSHAGLARAFEEAAQRWLNLSRSTHRGDALAPTRPAPLIGA